MRILGNVNIDGNLTLDKAEINLLTTISCASLSSVDVDFNNYDNVKLDLTNCVSPITINLLNGNEKAAHGHFIIIKQDDVTKREFNITLSNLSEDVDKDIKITESKVYKFVFTDSKFHPLNNTIITSSGGSYTEDNIYTSNNVIIDGQSYNESLSLLDSNVGKLIPSAPSNITNTTFTETVSNSKDGLHKISDGSVVNNVNYQDLSVLSSKFNDPKTGDLKCLLNNTQYKNTLPLTINDDTNTSNEVQITENSKENEYHRTIISKVLLDISEIGYSDTEQILELQTTNDSLKSTQYYFYCDEVNVSQAPINTSIADNGSLLTTFSGIPVYTDSNTLALTSTLKSVISNFYKTQVAKITSDVIEDTYYDIPITTYTNNQDITMSKTLAIKDNVFNSNTKFSVVGIKADDSFTTALNNIGKTNRIVTDSITKSLSFFDHSLKLSTNSSLLLIDGKFSYPYGNWEDVENGLGATITGIDYSNFSGYRYITIPLIVHKSSVFEVDFIETENFTDSAIDLDTNYKLEANIDGGDWIDCNSAYKGYGEVGSNEGGLMIGYSSKNKKVFTFGKNFSGTINLRISLNENSNKKFSQDINFTTKY